MVRNDSPPETAYTSFQSQPSPEDFGFQGLSLQPNYELSPSDPGPSMSQDTVFTDYNDNFYTQPTPGEGPMDETDPYDIPALGDLDQEVVGSEAASDNNYVCELQNKHGNLCGKKFPRQCDLTKHQKNHSRPTPCEHCPLGFAERKDLERHMNTHHPYEAAVEGLKKDEKLCPLMCGYKGRADNLKRHVEKKHPESFPDLYGGPVKERSSKKGKEKAR
ncbi:hypothetical protein QBC47DRAFT_152638 [Echria macrotheca]|uniref:C2H2-type domain-containing protein n=1 Tax=Echria macrotheca TaxID=438768 RepID=A0AAJ0F3F3_9PEZI|nr:hypothetical protein QBC47DRAFT_152638 [Echria macrotheca]